MSEHILYGDGIHDDTAAIQELIDSGLPREIGHRVPRLTNRTERCEARNDYHRNERQKRP